MNLYAESSAVLSWLFGEAKATNVRRHLRQADVVLASDLTLVECDRVIIRARALREITEKRAESCRRRLLEAAAHWYVLRVSADVVQRARQPFPNEPIRTLDALHVASAVLGRSAIPDLTILSLDERIRSASTLLNFPVLPQ